MPNWIDLDAVRGGKMNKTIISPRSLFELGEHIRDKNSEDAIIKEFLEISQCKHAIEVERYIENYLNDNCLLINDVELVQTYGWEWDESTYGQVFRLTTFIRRKGDNELEKE